MVIWREKLVNFVLLGEKDWLNHMRQVKSIQVNHYRKQHPLVFTNAEGTEDIINNILTILSDNAPARGDLYQRFVGKLKIYLRVAYELCFFVAVWVVAYQTMVFKRNLMIIYEAATTGTSTAQIINQQNASSGMWAFSEGNEVLYLVVLFYLLWPICFNAVGHLPKLWASSKNS
jgi:hypothetical protein